MFWVVPPLIIRSAYNCIYGIWYLSDRYCYLPLYHPKYVEQFPDKINCVTLHLFGYMLEYFLRCTDP